MQTKSATVEITTTTTQPAASLSTGTGIMTDEQPPVSPQSRRTLPAQDAPKTCETCGNEYDKAFEVVMDGKSHTFDCFECAIQALAPACAHCGCAIIGHGVEKRGDLYCCDHCARHTSPMPAQAGD